VDEIRPLQFFPVAFGHYSQHPHLAADEEAEHILDLLKDFAPRPVPWAVPTDQRTMDPLHQRMKAWMEPELPADTILYWVGHGWSGGNDDGATLAHADSPDPPSINAVTPQEVVKWVARREKNRLTGDTWALVVIEACCSGRFVELTESAIKRFADGPRRVALIGVTDNSSTRLGRFRQALRRVLEHQFGEDPQIKLWSLVMELGQELDASVMPPATFDAILYRRVPVPVGLPMDVATEMRAILSRLSDEEQRHFIPKAQGAELVEIAWFFEGRQAERRRICAWLRAPGSGMEPASRRSWASSWHRAAPHSGRLWSGTA
jgi:hypothetical protein